MNKFVLVELMTSTNPTIDDYLTALLTADEREEVVQWNRLAEIQGIWDSVEEMNRLCIEANLAIQAYQEKEHESQDRFKHPCLVPERIN